MIDRVEPPRPKPTGEGAKRLRRREAIVAAKLTDWTVARFGLARPVVFVSGFWRSGTTWLQELLAESVSGKTVFEPLSPQNAKRRKMLLAAGLATEFHEAFIPMAATAEDQMWPYLDRAFYGDDASRFSYSCRKTVDESLRRSIIVKDVRLQFNLPAVHDRYHVPIVHIRRHPGAVVSSLLSMDWSWNFERIRLADVLPSLMDEIQAFDTDPVSRISAYWAVTERHVDKALRDKTWATIVSYEDMLSAPRPAVSALCGFIGLEQRAVPNFNAPSASYFKPTDVHAFHTGPRGWRGKLPAEDTARIRAVVAQLYPAFDFDPA